jgi:hypothetical protein
MALQLKLKYEQSNDATILRLTDDTGSYRVDNITGWGVPNPMTADVVNFSDTTTGKYHLGLTITITTSDGVVTVYPDIDLKSYFPDQLLLESGMVFDILCSHLGIGSLPDGIWNIKYYLKAANSTTIASYVIVNLFVDGIVELKVSRSFLEAVFTVERGITQSNWNKIKDSLVKEAYLIGARANPSLAQQGKKLNILRTLQNYTIND